MDEYKMKITVTKNVDAKIIDMRFVIAFTNSIVSSFLKLHKENPTSKNFSFSVKGKHLQEKKARPLTPKLQLFYDQNNLFNKNIWEVNYCLGLQQVPIVESLYMIMIYIDLKKNYSEPSLQIFTKRDDVLKVVILRTEWFFGGANFALFNDIFVPIINNFLGYYTLGQLDKKFKATFYVKFRKTTKSVPFDAVPFLYSDCNNYNNPG